MIDHVASKILLNKWLLLAITAIATFTGPTVRAAGAQAVLQWPQPIPAFPPIPAGYRVGEIRVIGAKFLKPEFLVAGLGQKSGEALDEVRLRKALDDIKKLYGSLGYLPLIPVPTFDLDEQRKIVNLTVNIDEGRQFKINRIRFTGNTTTPDVVIRREIPLIEGYVFNSSVLEPSLLRLNRLGLFEQIRIEDFSVQPAPNEAKVDIILRVKEKAR